MVTGEYSYLSICNRIFFFIAVHNPTNRFQPRQFIKIISYKGHYIRVYIYMQSQPTYLLPLLENKSRQNSLNP